MRRWWLCILVSVGCGGPKGEPAPYVVPVVHQDHSLFWNDSRLLDDRELISFKKLMGIAALDGHGGALVQQWFQRFSSTAHSERALPAQFIDDFARVNGSDPTLWDLDLMGFKVTGVHNRIDRADFSSPTTGSCGELRASVSSTDVTLQPFHALFIFKQPLAEGDVEDGRVTCTATARKWAAMSLLEGDALLDAVRTRIHEGFVGERFALIETVEFTLSPWEWRQWTKGPASGPLPFTLDNPPLFQQLDVEGLNAAGPRRDELLTWVADNAAALNARTLLFPEKLRAPSVRVQQVATGASRTPLSLSGLRAEVASQYPQLRQQIEIAGCAACHTADADFVQTHSDRTVSKFYEKELKARERHLERLARGEAPVAPFGPLQDSPVLPQ